MIQKSLVQAHAIHLLPPMNVFCKHRLDNPALLKGGPRFGSRAEVHAYVHGKHTCMRNTENCSARAVAYHLTALGEISLSLHEVPKTTNLIKNHCKSHGPGMYYSFSLYGN